MALLTFVALFFTFDFAVIGAGLLIRAFVASNNQVDHLRGAIPKGTILNVDRDDITNTGSVSIAAQAVIGALVTAAALAVLFRSKTRPRIFTIIASLLAFTSLWLLGSTIAFTVIFATKSARATASLGGVQLPQSLIDAQARALGVSPRYKDQSYLLHAAILPWFTWLFTIFATIAVFSESRVRHTENGGTEKLTAGTRETTPPIA